VVSAEDLFTDRDLYLDPLDLSENHDLRSSEYVLEDTDPPFPVQPAIHRRITQGILTWAPISLKYSADCGAWLSG
jgi:hypothetical protein